MCFAYKMVKRFSMIVVVLFYSMVMSLALQGTSLGYTIYRIDHRSIHKHTNNGYPSTTHGHHRTSDKIVYAIVSKIENRTIYAKDGRKFIVPDSVNIINTSKLSYKLRIAKILFKNGKIVSVVIH